MLKAPEIRFEECFFCKDGHILRNLEDLKEEMRRFVSKQKSIDPFKFHLRDGRNDYASWIEGVFNIKDLAEMMRKTNTPEEIIKAIEAYEENQDVKPAKTQDVNEDDLLKGIHERTDKSEAMYDKMKQMKKNSLYRKENFEDTVSKIHEEYEELKKDISEHRKEGKDMFIAYLKIRNIKPKIDYYQVSQNKDDLEKIESMLRDIRQEINDAIAYEEPDLKQEIMNEIKMQKVVGE